LGDGRRVKTLGQRCKSASGLSEINMAKKARQVIILECSECHERNYATTKNVKTQKERLEFKKFCPKCRKHTIHKESK